MTLEAKIKEFIGIKSKAESLMDFVKADRGGKYIRYEDKGFDAKGKKLRRYIYNEKQKQESAKKEEPKKDDKTTSDAKEKHAFGIITKIAGILKAKITGKDSKSAAPELKKAIQESHKDEKIQEKFNVDEKGYGDHLSEYANKEAFYLKKFSGQEQPKPESKAIQPKEESGESLSEALEGNQNAKKDSTKQPEQKQAKPRFNMKLLGHIYKMATGKEPIFGSKPVQPKPESNQTPADKIEQESKGEKANNFETMPELEKKIKEGFDSNKIYDILPKYSMAELQQLDYPELRRIAGLGYRKMDKDLLKKINEAFTPLLKEGNFEYSTKESAIRDIVKYSKDVIESDKNYKPLTDQEYRDIQDYRLGHGSSIMNRDFDTIPEPTPEEKIKESKQKIKELSQIEAHPETIKELRESAIEKKLEEYESIEKATEEIERQRELKSLEHNITAAEKIGNQEKLSELQDRKTELLNPEKPAVEVLEDFAKESEGKQDKDNFETMPDSNKLIDRIIPMVTDDTNLNELPFNRIQDIVERSSSLKEVIENPSIKNDIIKTLFNRLTDPFLKKRMSETYKDLIDYTPEKEQAEETKSIPVDIKNKTEKEQIKDEIKELRNKKNNLIKQRHTDYETKVSGALSPLNYQIKEVQNQIDGLTKDLKKPETPADVIEQAKDNFETMPDTEPIKGLSSKDNNPDNIRKAIIDQAKKEYIEKNPKEQIVSDIPIEDYVDSKFKDYYNYKKDYETKDDVTKRIKKDYFDKLEEQAYSGFGLDSKFLNKDKLDDIHDKLAYDFNHKLTEEQYSSYYDKFSPSSKNIKDYKFLVDTRSDTPEHIKNPPQAPADVIEQAKDNFETMPDSEIKGKHTEGVVIQGDKAIKKITDANKDEFKVYEILKGIDGVPEATKEGEDSFSIPVYEVTTNVNEDDEDKKKDVKDLIVSENHFSKINKIFNELSKNGVYYNDVPQFGVDNSGDINLIDFSSSMIVDPKDNTYREENLNNLKSFYSAYGMDNISSAINDSVILRGRLSNPTGRKLIEKQNPEILKQLSNNESIDDFPYTYISTNTRPISGDVIEGKYNDQKRYKIVFSKTHLNEPNTIFIDHKSLSESMEGNQNAFKGGEQEPVTKPVTPADVIEQASKKGVEQELLNKPQPEGSAIKPEQQDKQLGDAQTQEEKKNEYSYKGEKKTFLELWKKDENFSNDVRKILKDKIISENKNIRDQDISRENSKLIQKLKDGDTSLTNEVYSKLFGESDNNKVLEETKTINDKIKQDSEKEIEVKKQELKEKVDNLKNQWNGKTFGDVNVTINDEGKAELKFPFDLVFSGKLKKNYGADFDYEKKVWVVNPEYLPKIEKLKVKYTGEQDKAKEEKAKRGLDQKNKIEQERRNKREEEKSLKDTQPNVKEKIETKEVKKETLNNFKNTVSEKQPSGNVIKRTTDIGIPTSEQVGDIIKVNGEYKKVKSIKSIDHPENEINNPYDYTEHRIEFEDVQSPEDIKKVEELKKQDQEKSVKEKAIKEVKEVFNKVGYKDVNRASEGEVILDNGDRNITDKYIISGDRLISLKDDFDGNYYQSEIPLDSKEAKDFIEKIRGKSNQPKPVTPADIIEQAKDNFETMPEDEKPKFDPIVDEKLNSFKDKWIKKEIEEATESLNKTNTKRDKKFYEDRIKFLNGDKKTNSHGQSLITEYQKKLDISYKVYLNMDAETLKKTYSNLKNIKSDVKRNIDKILLENAFNERNIQIPEPEQPKKPSFSLTQETRSADASSNPGMFGNKEQVEAKFTSKNYKPVFDVSNIKNNGELITKIKDKLIDENLTSKASEFVNKAYKGTNTLEDIKDIASDYVDIPGYTKKPKNVSIPQTASYNQTMDWLEQQKQGAIDSQRQTASDKISIAREELKAAQKRKENSDKRLEESKGNSDSFKIIPASDLKTKEQYTSKDSFDKPVIEGIKQSILASGYDQSKPITIDQDGFVVDGHHRFTAVQELIKDGKIPKDTPIPTITKKYESETDRLMDQVSANKMRRQVNPLDDSKAYKKLIDSGKTVQEIGERTGESVEKIKNTIALSNLVPELQDLIQKQHMASRKTGKQETGTETKQKNIRIQDAYIIGTYGLNEDGKPNSTIQMKAFKYANENKPTPSQLQSYIKNLTSQSFSFGNTDSSGRSAAEKEALESAGGEEKAFAQSGKVDNFIKESQKVFSKLFGQGFDADPKLIKELTASVMGTKGKGSAETLYKHMDALIQTLQVARDQVKRSINEIEGNASMGNMFAMKSDISKDKKEKLKELKELLKDIEKLIKQGEDVKADYGFNKSKPKTVSQKIYEYIFS